MNATATVPDALLTEAEIRKAPLDDYMSPRQLAFFRAKLIEELVKLGLIAESETSVP